MHEFLEKEDKGLPVKMCSLDLEGPDREYKKEVVAAYENKPANYKMMLYRCLASEKTACRCKPQTTATAPKEGQDEIQLPAMPAEAGREQPEHDSNDEMHMDLVKTDNSLIIPLDHNIKHHE